MLVNILIKKAIVGKNRTMTIQNVKRIVFNDNMALFICQMGDREEEVIYPIERILGITE